MSGEYLVKIFLQFWFDVPRRLHRGNIRGGGQEGLPYTSMT